MTKIINSPKVIKDELFRTSVINNICEIINDSLVIVYLFFIIKNWTKKTWGTLFLYL